MSEINQDLLARLAQIIDPVSWSMTPAHYATDVRGFMRTQAFGAQLVSIDRARAALNALQPGDEIGALMVAPKEPFEAMISAGAHVATGEVNGNCCAKTGGYGRDDGKHCECREFSSELYRAMLAAVYAGAKR